VANDGVSIERPPQAGRSPSYRNPLRRIEWLLDESPLSKSAKATRIRHIVGALFFVYGVILFAINTSHGTLAFAPFIFLLLSLPILFNRLGRLGRYFLPVCLALFAYGTAASYVDKYKLTVHYQPQIEFDRWLGNGTIPTVWLQEHLYHGHAGPLESICVVFYASHFAIPLALGLLLALLNRSNDFKFLMFAILAVSLLGAITFLVAPTAPPWLADRDGHLTGVHEILKQGLRHVHLSALAELIGDATKYDVTAAAPSLHTAYPLICIVAAARACLPKVVIGTLVLNLVGVVFAIVYMGEHYVFDVVVGAAYALAAIAIVRKALQPDDTAVPAVSSRRAAALP
jgi:hypothetical protein